MVHSARMAQTDPQYKLRMPADLKAQIEEAAKRSGRTMNAEIVMRLKASFDIGLRSEVENEGDPGAWPEDYGIDIQETLADQKVLYRYDGEKFASLMRTMTRDLVERALLESRLPLPPLKLKDHEPDK